ncbi:hypothetical protein KIPB_013137, partial [Kipferlia bialata]|eukprot:g13137.t1
MKTAVQKILDHLISDPICPSPWRLDLGTRASPDTQMKLMEGHIRPEAAPQRFDNSNLKISALSSHPRPWCRAPCDALQNQYLMETGGPLPVGSLIKQGVKCPRCPALYSYGHEHQCTGAKNNITGRHDAVKNSFHHIGRNHGSQLQTEVHLNDKDGAPLLPITTKTPSGYGKHSNGRRIDVTVFDTGISVEVKCPNTFKAGHKNSLASLHAEVLATYSEAYIGSEKVKAVPFIISNTGTVYMGDREEQSDSVRKHMNPFTQLARAAASIGRRTNLQQMHARIGVDLC